jgi:tRNA modification GTPase
MQPVTPASDTIVAVSSPPGRSARGLLRISGDAAWAVLTALIDAPSATRLSEKQLTTVRLKHPPLPALAGWYQPPGSYTGQATAELQVPGHPALLERLIQQATTAGARLAEAGEFTFRAFTAGKLDLTQAEGIAATISATSDSQLRAASLLRQGKLGALAGELVQALSDTLALVEAGIDFSDEEDVSPITPEDLARRVAQVSQQLSELLSRSRSWGEVDALPRVVLVGPPSSGKTALFNALLGSQRAVVSDVAGTTRDVLSEPLTVSGAHGQAVELMLEDLAGLDEPHDALSAQMQQAARDAIERADVLLCVQAIDQPSANRWPITLPAETSKLWLLTKADLASSNDCQNEHQPGALPVSAATGWHLDQLKQQLAQALADRATSLTSDVLALQPRHEQAIGQAVAYLDEAWPWIEPQRSSSHLNESEVIADALRGALDELAGLGGRMTPDDVLGKVFSTFCIGK